MPRVKKVSILDTGLDLLIQYEFVEEVEPNTYDVHPSFKKSFELFRDMDQHLHDKVFRPEDVINFCL